MNLTKIIILCLICFTTFGQSKIVKCYLFDKITNEPIENAYILSNNKPKTISAKDGSFEIIKGEDITISHIAYESLEIITSNLLGEEHYFLSAKNNILTEIKIYPARGIESIIKESIIRKKQNYKADFEQIFEINHVVKNTLDTLILIDGPLKLKWSLLDEHYFVDENTKIIRKYFDIINKSEYNFNTEAKRILYSLDIETFPFITNIDDYTYSVKQETDDYYLLSFSPKEEGRFNYEGDMKINKKDFAILIIDAELVKNKKNNKTTVINNFVPADKYHFLEEKMQYLFEKHSDSYYYFESAFHIIKMQQFKIGKIIEPKSLSVQTIILNSPKTTLKNAQEINLKDLTKASNTKVEPKSKGNKYIKEKITKELGEDEKNN